MREKHFYVNREGFATIVCPACGKAKPLNTVKLPPEKKSLTVKCACGEVFRAHIEYRKQYRKRVELPGEYASQTRSEDTGTVMVEDLSLGGLGFRTLRQHDIEVGDVLELTFTLDTRPPKTITRRVKALRVQGKSVGCAFVQALERDPDIGFYLMA